jgi:hypothetical protein
MARARCSSPDRKNCQSLAGSLGRQRPGVGVPPPGQRCSSASAGGGGAELGEVIGPTEG